MKDKTCKEPFYTNYFLYVLQTNYLILFLFLFILQEFLKKEFSEENILFWQACEYFSHVPETDKKQV